MRDFQKDYPDLEQIEQLRIIWENIFSDYDSHQGEFSKIDYKGPLDFVGQRWASEIGVEYDMLKNALTKTREVFFTKSKIDTSLVRIENEFIDRFKDWKTKEVIEIPPTSELDHIGKKYNNKYALQTSLQKLKSIGIENIIHESNKRQLRISGNFKTSVGLDASLLMMANYFSGGVLEFIMSFPLYNHDTEPTVFNSSHLMGKLFFYKLEVPAPKGINLYINDDEYQKDLHTFLEILSSLIIYFK
ncbi:hypothetical protein [Roseibium sp. RKSG952]|uniref:hypothetical protein n=1 Tax=Roseibium sp. RKSG952 TaxID=2529384 RepID=UPI0012BCDB5D|nr:hypothetical protein [Roseibium sp. RKSG952]MTH94741.1 hypothetical protein [Roseibium sp. RKSG952]